AVAAAAAVAWVLPLYAAQPFTLGQRLLTEARVVALYLGLFVWPHPGLLNIDHGVAVSTGLLNPATTLPALALHLGALGVGAWLWRRDRLASLLVWLFYLHQLPESSILPLDLAFEHRMSLPGLFLAIGVAYGVWRAARRLAGDPRGAATVSGVVLLGAAVALGVATRARNEAWASGVSLWEDAVRKAPDNPRARTNLGAQYLLRGDLARARAELEQAVRLDPRNGDGWVNLGIVHSELGDCEGALTRIGRARALGYRRAPVHYNAAVCLQELGRDGEALAEYEEALRLAPWTPDARWNMALIYLARGDRVRAEALAGEELRLNPDNREARELLTRAGLRPSGGEGAR
ncbi:MAG: tetratricopeptide repeat protein, partial [Deferrisomatales bacterium]